MTTFFQIEGRYIYTVPSSKVSSALCHQVCHTSSYFHKFRTLVKKKFRTFATPPEFLAHKVCRILKVPHKGFKFPSTTKIPPPFKYNAANSGK